jgi:hypothetical protein
MKLKIVLLWIFLVIAFCFTASFLLIEAYGYRINWDQKRIEKTGTIVVSGSPRNSLVKLNGQLVSESIPTSLNKLLPETYEVEIIKSGMQTWSKIVQVKPGQAVYLEHVLLFAFEPKAEKTETIEKTKIEANNLEQAKRLILKDNEIWLDENFVTRLSANIPNAIIGPDKFHIIFQLNNTLNVIDLDGANQKTLIKLSSTEKSSFFTSGNNLIYTDMENIFQAQIKEPSSILVWQ